MARLSVRKAESFDFGPPWRDGFNLLAPIGREKKLEQTLTVFIKQVWARDLGFCPPASPERLAMADRDCGILNQRTEHMGNDVKN
jgi:hypothetical protein